MKQNKILDLISKNPKGISSKSIINRINLSPSEIRMELSILIGAQQVSFKQDGSTKIYILRSDKHYAR